MCDQFPIARSAIGIHACVISFQLQGVLLGFMHVAGVIEA
jgi:hypothetical protein